MGEVVRLSGGYSRVKSVWKGVRGFLAALGALVLTAAIDAAVDAGLAALSDPALVTRALERYGPTGLLLVPAVVGLGAAGRNWWKNRRK